MTTCATGAQLLSSKDHRPDEWSCCEGGTSPVILIYPCSLPAEGYAAAVPDESLEGPGILSNGPLASILCSHSLHGREQFFTSVL